MDEPVEIPKAFAGPYGLADSLVNVRNALHHYLRVTAHHEGLSFDDLRDRHQGWRVFSVSAEAEVGPVPIWAVAESEAEARSLIEDAAIAELEGEDVSELELFSFEFEPRGGS